MEIIIAILLFLILFAIAPEIVAGVFSLVGIVLYCAFWLAVVCIVVIGILAAVGG